MPTVVKYPGPTQFWYTGTVPSTRSMRTLVVYEQPASKPQTESAADVAPGTALAADTSRSPAAVTLPPEAASARALKNDAVTRWSAAKPVSTRTRFSSDWLRSVAAKTITTETAS